MNQTFLVDGILCRTVYRFDFPEDGEEDEWQ